MSFWIPSDACRVAARRAVTSVFDKYFPKPAQGDRTIIATANNSRVLATDVEKLVCPHCSSVMSPEYEHGDNPPVPKYLYVDVFLRIPITAIPDKYREQASSEAKLERVKTSSSSSSSKPPELNLDELTEFLKV